MKRKYRKSLGTQRGHGIGSHALDCFKYGRFGEIIHNSHRIFCVDAKGSYKLFLAEGLDKISGAASCASRA